MSLISWIFLSLNAYSVLYTLTTTFHFMIFLSGNSNGLLSSPNIYRGLTMHKILYNVGLLCLFGLFHSFAASNTLKYFTSILNLSAIHRTCYNIVSCWILEILMENWIVLLPNIPFVWSTGDNFIVTICQIFHVASWLSIFSTIYILDFAEFMGINQVQFFSRNLGCPLANKTSQAQNLYGNMRHPVATGLLFVLWLVPCLSIDRFLFSSLFTLYFIHGCQLGLNDYKYVKEMYTRKHHTIDQASHH